MFTSVTSQLKVLAASVRIRAALRSDTFARSRAVVSCGVTMFVRALLECGSTLEGAGIGMSSVRSVSSCSSSSVPSLISSIFDVDGPESFSHCRL